MTRIVTLLTGLAIVAASATTTHADIAWAAGAPGGTPGTSLEFDNDAGGAGLFLDTGIASSALTDYSISTWINADTLNTTNAGSWYLGTGFRGLHLGVRNSANAGPATTLSQGHWSNDSDGTTTLTTGTWYHATYTYDADGGTGGTTGQQSIYLNGVLETQVDNGAPNDTTTNVILGARNNGNNGPQWDGRLDDVGVWTSVLSAADIADLASGVQGAVALGADAYWDFEDDVFGTTAANQGTLGAALTGITPNAVPEPSSLAIMLGLGALGFVRRKRS